MFGRSISVKMAVVITVPHSAPAISKDGHPSDTLSRTAGISIHEKLKSPKRLFVNLSVPRNLCDLNRPPGNCGFIPYLEEYLQNNKVRFLLDIHSYPSGHGDWGNYEVIFLDTEPFQSFGLSNLLTSRGVHNNILRASMCDNGEKCNYIISLARFDHNIPAIIIEFNEDLSTERLQFIAGLIAEWF